MTLSAETLFPGLSLAQLVTTIVALLQDVRILEKWRLTWEPNITTFKFELQLHGKSKVGCADHKKVLLLYLLDERQHLPNACLQARAKRRTVDLEPDMGVSTYQGGSMNYGHIVGMDSK